MDLLDLTPFVDEHGRRTEALRQGPAQRTRQIAPRRDGGSAGRGAQGCTLPGRPAKRRLRCREVISPVEPGAAVQRQKELLGAGRILGGTEQKESSGIQAVVERPEQALLGVGLQVDQEIPAGDEIDAGEGRVVQHVLDREDHEVSQLLPDAIEPILSDEKLGEPRGADVRRDALGIAPRASDLDRRRVEVRGEQLDFQVLLQLAQGLEQEDDQRIGLLTRRTARDPDPQQGTVFAFREKFGKRGPERPEGFRIAEEAADADQPVVPEGIDLDVALLQVARVLLQAANAVEVHPPRDTPSQCRVLVLGEVAAAALAHDGED